MVASYAGPQMTLANMRSLGVRSITAACACGHDGKADVSQLADDLPVPMVRQRLLCSQCGSRPLDVRPDWSEYRALGVGRAD